MTMSAAAKVQQNGVYLLKPDSSGKQNCKQQCQLLYYSVQARREHLARREQHIEHSRQRTALVKQ